MSTEDKAKDNKKNNSQKKVTKEVHPTLFHRFVFSAARLFAGLHVRMKYGFTVKNPVKMNEPFIVMSNHATDNDMLFVIMGVKNHVYFVCSEHLLRTKGIVGWAVKHFDEIPMFKGSVATTTVREIIKRIKAGNNICIFPEGSRNFDGRTNPIAESTAKLVKLSKCALVTFKIHGGYFVQPRWAKTWRKGPMSGEVMNVYSSEQIAKMSADEINAAIRADLAEDAYEIQKMKPVKYTGKGLAEGLENILYICPKCKGFETIRSNDNKFWCEACDMTGIYDEYGMLNSEQMSYRTVPEWEDWENEEFDRMYEEQGDDLLFRNQNVRLSILHKDHTEEILFEGELTGDKNGFKIGEYSFPYKEMDATEYVNLGNTFLFTSHDTYYSMVSDYLCGVKYRKLYIKYKEKEAAELGIRFDAAK